MKRWMMVGISMLLGAGLAQAAIVTNNLVQELNADDIGAVTNASTWTARTGANATLGDNTTAGFLSKEAATVNDGYTSTVFSNTLSTSVGGSAVQKGATMDALVGTTMSIELWVSPDFSDTPTESHTIFETGGEGRGMSITLGDNGSGTNNTLRFAMKDGGGTSYVEFTLDAAAMADFTDGDHHQLVVTHDNVNNMSLYIDGALVAENTTSGSKDWDGTSKAGIWGTDGSGWVTTDTLDADGEGHGSVAVFRHYSDVLSAAEVLQNYSATIPIPNYYVGSGPLTDAANWDLGLPSNTNLGVVATTDGGSQDFGSTFWVNSFQVRQTGGTITDTADLGIALRGGASNTTDNCTFEIDDASNTAFGYANLAVSGQLTLWNQYAASGSTGNILSLLNGYATAAILAGTSPADNFINILNGRLDVGYFGNARVTVNMLAGGTGQFNLDDMYVTGTVQANLDQMVLNFESGSEASFTILASNVTGNAQGYWETKVAAGQVKIDGTAVTSGLYFTIEDVGATGTKISLLPATLVTLNTEGTDAFDRYAQDEATPDGTGDWLSPSQNLTLGFPGKLTAGNRRQLWDFDLPELSYGQSVTNATLTFRLGNITDGSPDFSILGSLVGTGTNGTPSLYEDTNYTNSIGSFADGDDNTTVNLDVTAFINANYDADGGNTWASFRIQSDDVSGANHNAQLGGFSNTVQVTQLTLLVTDPPPATPTSLYASWIDGYGVGDTAMDADPDGDTYDNLLEYAFGGNPDDANDQGNAPVTSLMEETGTNWFYHVYYEHTDKAARGLDYSVEAGTDLVITNWGSVAIDPVGSGAGPAGFNAVTNRIPTDTEGKQFIKLDVDFTE